MGLGVITTYTGKDFDIQNPEFDIIDIAHALSNTCRYAGHCSEFYSVAEHSVLASLLMEELELGDPLAGLMHDGHEAYFSDVPAPFKPLMPEWVEMDRKLEEALLTTFDLPYPREQGCKDADVLAFFIERPVLFDDGGNESWRSKQYPELKERAVKLVEEGWTIKCYDPWFAKKAFLDRYDKLQKQAGKG